MHMISIEYVSETEIYVRLEIANLSVLISLILYFLYDITYII